MEHGVDEGLEGVPVGHEPLEVEGASADEGQGAGSEEDKGGAFEPGSLLPCLRAGMHQFHCRRGSGVGLPGVRPGADRRLGVDPVRGAGDGGGEAGRGGEGDGVHGLGTWVGWRLLLLNGASTRCGRSELQRSFQLQ